jgi:NADPH:quinone reductase-like Zn-dependent oxidoreductase
VHLLVIYRHTTKNARYENKKNLFFGPGSGFSGLVVSMLASGTQVRGFKPGQSRQIFQVKKSSA